MSESQSETVAHSDMGALRAELWEALGRRDEHTAVAAVIAALDKGAHPEEVLLGAIAAVQFRVGTEWASDRLTVAQEHAATAINERVIAAVACHPAAATPATAGHVTVACIDGEWHALPARLVAEVLRLRGWQVEFLGAHVPTHHLIAHIHQHDTDAVLLSSSLATRLPTAHATITACQAAGVPVLVGGAAFGADDRYARLLAADGWAADARGAARELERGLRRRQPNSAGVPSSPPTHRSDQEYTLVVRTKTQLIAATVTDLENSYPPMRAYTELQRERTAEDIAHIVDFLATALYIDDDGLFSTFVLWTADVLTARGVPAPALSSALCSLSAQLAEFPRTRRILRHAHEVMTTPDRVAVHAPGIPESPAAGTEEKK
ncbi:cobalamin B12-binding domain-containing protein [Nocardia grenadensis]